MNKLSIFKIIILTSFMSYTQVAVGQDSLIAISESWQNLKTQLLKRADVFITLATDFNKTKRVDKEIADKINSAATALKQFLDTAVTIDTMTIQKSYQFNFNLTQAISSLLTALIKDEKFKHTEEARNLQIQLEGSENRIMVAKRKYNDTCSEYKRTDLLFDSNQKTKSIQVSF